MPRIVNVFKGTDPTAEVIGNLGKTLWGDTATGNLKRERLRAAERENVETENLMALTGRSGAHNLGSSPLAHALLIGSGYAPSKYADMGLMGAANAYGAADPRTVNAQIGAGKPFSSTATAFYRSDDTDRRGQDIASGDRRYGIDQRVGEDARQFDMMPVETLREGQPAFAPRSDVFDPGYAPILSETQQKGTQLGNQWGDLKSLPTEEQRVLGADPGSQTGALKMFVDDTGRRFVTRDGVTDVNGTRLPRRLDGSLAGQIVSVEGSAADVGLTNSVQTDLQSDEISYQKFNSLIDQAMPLTDDPSLFGPQGLLRSKGQEIMQGIGGVQEIIGARENLSANLGEAAPQLLPELYDPRLSEVETLWGLIVYQGASALAGQENRSVSDKDVQFMRHILGDPRSFFSSNLSAKTKLTTAQQVVERYRAITTQARTQGLGRGNAPAEIPGAAERTDAAPRASAPLVPQGQPQGPVPWETYFGGQ